MEPCPEERTLQRVVVLLPDCLAMDISLAHKIHWLAKRENRDVLYLTIFDDELESLSVSRCLATLKAATAGGCLQVESLPVESCSWLKTLRQVYRHGDVLACLAEQTVAVSFSRTLPIAAYLQEHFPGSRVECISGFYHPQQVQVQLWLRALLTWAGFLLILAGFTWLEIDLDQAMRGALRMIATIAVLCIEFACVLAWNRLSSR